MNKPHVARKNSSNAIRLFLIPALVLVLIAVLFWPVANKANTTSLQLSQDSIAMATAPSESTVNRRIWPVFRLNDVIACNPFRPLQTTSSGASMEKHDVTGVGSIDPAENEVTVASSTPGTLQAIYFDAHGAAAILDSRVVRIGDILANGSKVVAINSQGISLDALE